MKSAIASPPNTLLDISGVALSFGGLKAVQAFSLQLPRGGLYGLIGPNGAGKTTVFNLLTGVYTPDAGAMRLDGRSLNGQKPHRITAAGIARTFQNIRLFGELSVLDNVRLAGQMRRCNSLPSSLFRTAGCLGNEQAVEAHALKLLDLFDLRSRAHEPARSLPYGSQRKIEIVRALATQPRVLLLDEPAAGMNTQEKRQLSATIRRIRDEFEVSILLIEHDMGLVMEVCERITVLDHGVTIAEGTPAEIQRDPKVIAAYLGGEREGAEGGTRGQGGQATKIGAITHSADR